MAKSFGVKDKYLFRDEEATKESMSKTYEEIQRLNKKFTTEKQQHLVMFYFAGHGATYDS